MQQLEILDAGEETLPITTFTGEPEPTAITLFLTTTCNLRCTYCYASAGDTPLKNMQINVAEKGIRFIIKNALKKEKKYIDIAYHGGGEPTTNWKTMTQSLTFAKSEAKKVGLKVRASSASNGVLNDSQIDWILENLKGVSLSFDGLPEVQDKHRITSTGKGSSRKVLYTMKRFDDAGFPYSIRMTVTHDLIHKLPRSVEFICSKFNPSRIQVEPAYQMGRWTSAPSAETQEFISAYRQAKAIARKYSKEISFSGARLGLLTNHFCGVTQDTFALSPDGNVSACYEVFIEDGDWAEVFFYGQPIFGTDDYHFNLPILNDLRNQAIQHRDFCSGCFAKWSCGGDCYHKSLTVSEKKEFEGTDRCHIIRELTKDQILEKISQAGSFFWHEENTINTSKSAGKEFLFSS